MPIQGLQFTIPNNTEQHQSYQATGSFVVYNPNDGVCFVATDRTASLQSWDYKIPSQSGGKFPGPINSYLSLYFQDQSGASSTSQVVVYASMDKLDIPHFWSIGRALLTAGSTLDINTGNQPQNPPQNSVRLWVDGTGTLHKLDATGVDEVMLDNSNYATYIGGYVMGGDVQQTLNNTLVDRASGGFTVARNNANTGNTLMPGLNFAAGGGEGISSARSGTNVFGLTFWTNSAPRMYIDNAAGNIVTSGNLGVGILTQVSGVTRYLYLGDTNHYISDGSGIDHMSFTTYTGLFSWYAVNTGREWMTLTAGGGLYVHNDLHSDRSNDSGYWYPGNSGNHYVGFDGSNWIFSSPGAIYTGGDIQAGNYLGNFSLLHAARYAYSEQSMSVNTSGSNNGTLASSGDGNGLYFGGIGGGGSGEGIASKRTGGGNQFGLDFYFGWSVGVQMNGSGITIIGNNLFFGTLNGSNRIQWNGTYFNFSNSIQFNTTGNQVVWPNGSYISGNAGYVQGSQQELKQNIVVLDDAALLTQVIDTRMPVNSYNWPGDDRQSVGFMAEDVAQVLPLYVMRDDKGQPSGYVPQELTAILWGAVRSLDARVRKLETPAI